MSNNKYYHIISKEVGQRDGVRQTGGRPAPGLAAIFSFKPTDWFKPLRT
jgi:hypothetical protein